MAAEGQAGGQRERHNFEWFNTGYALLEAKLAAIAQARKIIRMETYIFKDDDTGRRFREALIEAGRRGVKVRLLVDAIGGMELGELTRFLGFFDWGGWGCWLMGIGVSVEVHCPPPCGGGCRGWGCWWMVVGRR